LKYQINTKLEECFEGYKTLQSQLRGKKNKYKEEELRNKMDRLERLNENLEVLKEMYMDQNAFEIGKTGGRIQQNADIEN
jgi:chromosome segregation ATPase